MVHTQSLSFQFIPCSIHHIMTSARTPLFRLSLRGYQRSPFCQVEQPHLLPYDLPALTWLTPLYQSSSYTHISLLFSYPLYFRYFLKLLLQWVFIVKYMTIQRCIKKKVILFPSFSTPSYNQCYLPSLYLSAKDFSQA